MHSILPLLGSLPAARNTPLCFAHPSSVILERGYLHAFYPAVQANYTPGAARSSTHAAAVALPLWLFAPLQAFKHSEMLPDL